MAVPSSPPLPPLQEYSSSPILHPADDNAAELPVRPTIGLAGVGGGRAGSRKRQFSDYDYGNSSDPFFSEGTSDADEGIEESQQPQRKKKLVRGPWWTVRRAMAKRERQRVLDSGVWLGSDASEESVDSTISSRQRFARLDVGGAAAASSSSAVPVSASPASPAEVRATKTVAACLDAGKEIVDLSNLGLVEIRNATLQPLHQLIRHTHNDLTEPPSEDEFGPLTPSLQLFLSGNKLSSLPTELFKLTNTAVLSLRNNSLTHLPPAVGELVKLKELNIAQNSIQHLPWELFALYNCPSGGHRQITTRPNPLVDPVSDLRGPSPLPRPQRTPAEFKEYLSRWGETNGAFFARMRHWYGEDDVEWTMRHELELRLKLGRLKRTNYLQEASRAGEEIQLCKEQLIYLASSAVRYLGIDGRPMRHSPPSKTAEGVELYRAVQDPLIHTPEDATIDHVPSLFELALRSLQPHLTASDTDELTAQVSTAVSSALQTSAKNRDDGNETCATCEKKFIIPRAEWMEFWFNGFPSQEALTQESVLPFLRRVCSWGCAVPSALGEFRV